ncbi:MAG: ribosome biogenesis GTP-binding protein YihA/YsxC [Chitinophagales bacterium]
MLIKSAEYLASSVSVSKCPEPTLPEYAFIGRSNVGKSSLINMLTERNKLAKVSNTPGKTQTINHFIINDEWYLVDLPGYGYAKISKVQRKKWEQFIRNYLQKRMNLQCVFLLIDSRIPPQPIDLEFANWLGEMMIPFVIVFTKTDDRKYKPENVEVFRAQFLETWEEMPQHFLTSARKKTGREDVLGFIEEVNGRFEAEKLLK